MGNHYYFTFIKENRTGRWNVVQVIDGHARYFVLNGDVLEVNPETGPFLAHGRIEQEDNVIWFVDGDYTDITAWEKREGILIPFEY